MFGMKKIQCLVEYDLCKSNKIFFSFRYKDGKRIQVTDKTTIHHGKKGGSLLMVHTCDFSDMGLYKVEAHNMAGRCSGSAKLTVFGLYPILNL